MAIQFEGGSERLFSLARPPSGSFEKKCWVYEAEISHILDNLPGIEGTDRLQRLTSAHKILTDLCRVPEPTPEPEPAEAAARRKWRIDKAVAADLINPVEYEQQRIWAWASTFTAEGNTLAREAMDQYWDADNFEFVLPDEQDVVPDGWPEGADPEAHIRAYHEDVTPAALPGTEPEDPDPEPDAPPNDMQRMLDALERPGGRPGVAVTETDDAAEL